MRMTKDAEKANATENLQKNSLNDGNQEIFE